MNAIINHKTKQQVVTCMCCKNAKLVQFYFSNISNPVLCECQMKPEDERQSREVANYHTCKLAEKAERMLPVQRIEAHF